MFLFILEFYTFEFCVSLFLAESIFFMIKYTLGPIQDTLYLFLEKKVDFILLKIWLKRNIINFVRWQLDVAWFYSWSEVTNNFACVVNLFVTSTQALALLPILTMAIMNIVCCYWHRMWIFKIQVSSFYWNSSLSLWVMVIIFLY